MASATWTHAAALGARAYVPPWNAAAAAARAPEFVPEANDPTPINGRSLVSNLPKPKPPVNITAPDPQPNPNANANPQPVPPARVPSVRQLGPIVSPARPAPKGGKRRKSRRRRRQSRRRR